MDHHHHSAAKQATTRFLQPLRSWAKEEKILAAAFFHLEEEQNQERDFHSSPDFCRGETICLYCLCFFHLFLSQRHNHYLEELLVVKMTFKFISFSHPRSLFHLELSLFCYAFDFCNPDTDPRFWSFLITATALNIIFVRLTFPKAHVMQLHNFHRLDGGLVMSTCDLGCSQKRRSNYVKPDELGCHSVAYPTPIARFPYPWTK